MATSDFRRELRGETIEVEGELLELAMRRNERTVGVHIALTESLPSPVTNRTIAGGRVRLIIEILENE